MRYFDSLTPWPSGMVSQQRNRAAGRPSKPCIKRTSETMNRKKLIRTGPVRFDQSFFLGRWGGGGLCYAFLFGEFTRSLWVSLLIFLTFGDIHLKDVDTNNPKKPRSGRWPILMTWSPGIWGERGGREGTHREEFLWQLGYDSVGDRIETLFQILQSPMVGKHFFKLTLLGKGCPMPFVEASGGDQWLDAWFLQVCLWW